MNKMLEQLRAAGQRAWLTFIQSLNAIAMALLGGALVVHQVYPDIVRQLLGQLGPKSGAAALFVFGVGVHLALRQAKKAGSNG